jgi:uncharacterized Tic20 family protein
MDTPISRTEDERLWAALAHGSIVFMGILGPLIIYLVKKEEAPWVGRQAIQSLLYHVAVGLGLSVVIFASITLTVVTAIGGAVISPESALAGVGFGWMCCWPLYLLAAVVYGFYGAYECYQGRNFKYKFIGNLVTGL